MFARHLAFPEPADSNTRIWRYIDLTRYVSMLATRSLHFARADQMPDPFEGTYPKTHLTEAYLASIFPGLSRDEKIFSTWPTNVSEMIKWNRQQHYLNCWHMNNFESEAMWRLYSPRPLAIRSTFQRLCDAFEACHDRDVYVGEVTYIDFESESYPMGNTFSSVLYKRRSFDYERELRAVVPLYSSSSPTAGNPLGLAVPVDLDSLVEAVYVDPRSSSWVIDAVRAVSERFGFNKDVVRSTLFDAWQ